ncbi:hypothetical protein BJ878DRAFT_497153 [Calycina marina]|uniref:Uncharacterized protein n=1 Tax=Calycina marina TaxID=1763456 RepID=A0A9P7Z6Y3_9HELO|nr:hypothetical protein BJ878DRAFT_497153 [Calycina marina]
MMMLSPICFEISANAYVTVARAHLMPSVVGDAVGGLLTGLAICRTRCYKPMAIIGFDHSVRPRASTLARTHGLS